MSDEFDDLVMPGTPLVHAVNSDRRRSRAPLAPRLVARLYASADQALRPKLLAVLVRPLSLLGLAAVAAGAFTRLPFTSAKGISVDDATRFSIDQIAELARFVEQVSPEALQRFAAMTAASPLGAAAFSASAVVLLSKALRTSRTP